MLTTVQRPQALSASGFPRLAVLSLTNVPHMRDRDGTTISPYSACIAYESDAVTPDRIWHGQFSGYRVLPNGLVDMETACIVLHSATDRDLIPDDLLTRIDSRVGTW
ncbi:hypothetical protein ACGFWD_42785 [Streptomyces sp. NPDC048448]|uniref:hypothetical protein n=1 Tax=Streptomyces sp. NPDC048448 TaxID=3365554 RepID=UPI00371C6B25